MFEHMKKAQEVAFAAIRPGAKCSDVDKAVRKYYEQNDVPFGAKPSARPASSGRTQAARQARKGRVAKGTASAVSVSAEPVGLMRFWKHHTGHAIGLRYHEGPFMDAGDHTVIRPGIVFTVEPGLYARELGGFRHSDTVVVTEDGIEILTYYPRDLDSLTIPV